MLKYIQVLCREGAVNIEGNNEILVEAYRSSYDNGYEYLNFDERTAFLTPTKLKELLDKFGINKFTVSDDSMFLLNTLKGYQDVGYKVKGLIELKGTNKPAILLQKEV